MKAYQPVVCATEDGGCGGLKHTRSWGSFHQLLYVQAVWGQTVGSSFFWAVGLGRGSAHIFILYKPKMEPQGQEDSARAGAS